MKIAKRTLALVIALLFCLAAALAAVNAAEILHCEHENIREDPYYLTHRDTYLYSGEFDPLKQHVKFSVCADCSEVLRDTAVVEDHVMDLEGQRCEQCGWSTGWTPGVITCDATSGTVTVPMPKCDPQVPNYDFTLYTRTAVEGVSPVTYYDSSKPRTYTLYPVAHFSTTPVVNPDSTDIWSDYYIATATAEDHSWMATYSSDLWAICQTCVTSVKVVNLPEPPAPVMHTIHITNVLAPGASWPSGLDESSIPPEHWSKEWEENTEYAVAAISVPGMTASPAVVTGFMGTSDVFATVTYSEGEPYNGWRQFSGVSVQLIGTEEDESGQTWLVTDTSWPASDLRESDIWAMIVDPSGRKYDLERNAFTVGDSSQTGWPEGYRYSTKNGRNHFKLKIPLLGQDSVQFSDDGIAAGIKENDEFRVAVTSDTSNDPDWTMATVAVYTKENLRDSATFTDGGGEGGEPRFTSESGYTAVEDDGVRFVTGVLEKTDLATFKSRMENADFFRFSDKDGKAVKDTDLVATGMRIETDDDVYCVLVKGDANCNGRIDAADYAMIKRNYLGTYALTDLQKRAGDVSGNKKIDGTDYAMVKRHYLNTYTIK